MGVKQVIFSDSVSMDKKINLKSETRIQTHLVVSVKNTTLELEQKCDFYNN